MNVDQDALKNIGIKMGSIPQNWMEGKTKDITFCVTEDCNLACKYCYMCGKNSQTRLSWEVAKKAIDFFLSRRDLFPEEAVVWNFVGGEPFLEIDLVDRMCDYIKIQSYKLNHPWFDKYMFNFSSNGLLYGKQKVQDYIQKNYRHLSIGISIDGNKIKHDMQRVKKDNSGSYDDIMKIVPLWLKQFPNIGTKATFAHDDLPFLKDSIISLWDIGVKMVLANCVFEDVWEEGDDQIFERQLKDLADYIIENKKWKDYSVRFFSPDLGHPISEEKKSHNFCGAGKMIAVDCKGNLYPCLRFYGISLENHKPIVIGHIETGIDMDKLRPFEFLDYNSQNSGECLECEIASGCAWCTGANYDFSENGTLYKRSTNICKMSKANARANEYFWNKLAAIDKDVASLVAKNKSMDNNMKKKNFEYLMIMTNDNITPHCNYKNQKGTSANLPEETLNRALGFTRENLLIPIVLGSIDNYNLDADYEKDRILNMIEAKNGEKSADKIFIYENEPINSESPAGNNAVLLINRDNIIHLPGYIEGSFGENFRINIILTDSEKWDDADIENYKQALDKLIELVFRSYKMRTPVEINVLTDIIIADEMINCDAGESTITLAPNGKFYICPAFYFEDPAQSIGSLEEGIHIPDSELLDLSRAPICRECDANHCRRCKYLNKKCTGEINTPSKQQCIISHIERNKARELQLQLEKNRLKTFAKKIPEINYLDPVEIIKEKRKMI